MSLRNRFINTKLEFLIFLSEMNLQIQSTFDGVRLWRAKFYHREIIGKSFEVFLSNTP